MESSLSIQFSKEAASSSGKTVWMEEEGWGADPNYITYGDFYLFTTSRLLNVSAIGNPYDLVSLVPPTHDCGITEGRLFNTIHVYRMDKSFGYNIHSSYGSIGSSQSSEFTHTEVINFRLENDYNLRYPVTGGVDGTWIGDIYNEAGSPTSAPSYTVEDGKLILSKKVYGSLKVTYTVYRTSHTLEVDAEDIMDDIFAGVVYALYDGGVSWLLLDKPPGLTQDLIEGAVECGWQWGNVSIGSDTLDPDEGEDSAPSEAPKVDTEITINYCTGLVESVDQEQS